MKIAGMIMIFLTPILIWGQADNAYCDGTRYLEPVFPDEPEMTTVKFGENTTINGNFRELFMDVFEPAGDEAQARPVILFAFGGSFITGDRSQVHEICKHMAKKGFVTAAIDYRIYDRPFPPEGPLPDSTDMMQIVLQAVSDYKAAIRYFRKDAAESNSFRTDPGYIFSGGYSAGSIASLHAAYLDEGEAPYYVQELIDAVGSLEGDTDDPTNSNISYSSEVQGVINFFGALHKKEWIDENDPPLISIHGDADPTVPYGHGFAVVVILPIITVDGSGELHPVADAAGIMNELITVPGGGHGNFSPEYYTLMDERTSLMLHEIMCGDFLGTLSESQIPLSFVFPNPATRELSIHFEGDPGTYSADIYDTQGLKVYAASDLNGDLRLRREEIGNGIFTLRLQFKKKSIKPLIQRIIFLP